MVGAATTAAVVETASEKIEFDSNAVERLPCLRLRIYKGKWKCNLVNPIIKPRRKTEKLGDEI